MPYTFFINNKNNSNFKQIVCGDLKWSVSILGNSQKLLKLKCSKLPINNDFI